MTVNGDVTLDCSCSSGAQYFYDDETGDYIYKRDDNGDILFAADSRESSITVNGNTGFLSLNKSYQGDVTINGDVVFSASYDDVGVEDHESPYEPPYEENYAPIPNAGKIMENGELLVDFHELEGYINHVVYEGNVCTRTERTIENEQVRGTSAAVNGDPLIVDVSADALGAATYPVVRTAKQDVQSKIQTILTNKDSKLTAIDISLIEDNETEVEPEKDVNLYLNELSGYQKPALFHIKEDGTIEKLFVSSESDFSGRIKCSTNSFSTYFVAEDQVLASNNINQAPTESEQQAEQNTTPQQENTATRQENTTPKQEESSGEWKQGADGKWWYENNDGSYTSSGWQQIGDTWYAFDASGYMVTGWYESGNTWYYLSEDGAMETGWVYDGQDWYYTDTTGAMETGWELVNGDWYYFTASGAMKTGWQDGGTWYYLNESGAMAHDTVIGGYRLNSKGAWVK
ncbi:MAG: N-acetylmuramoyl-L-alanine amidase family protein [Lachnospiraceae bacterium]|nr:N-acetylmuramoyl-L-alanine amidase family protein [Lachnospiraceae bacterium]